jgi:hypothetical protein
MKNFTRLLAIGIPAMIALYSCQKGLRSTEQPGLSLRANLLNAKPSANIQGAVSVFSTGFNNPRGLKFGPDGNLYVAEGGTGGTELSVGQCTQVVFPVGPYTGSPTGGRISKVNAAGVRTTVTDNLPSSTTNVAIGGDVSGVADVAFIGNTLYALLAGGGCSHGVPSIPNGIVKVNADGSWTWVANLSDWQHANPVLHPEPDDFEPDGTWYSMIELHGDLYALEPNHGELVKVTTAGNISRIIDISATQGHIVPTALAYHGNFYVGNLDIFPIPPSGSKVFKITPSGEIKADVSGLNTILGLVFDNRDRMFVLEMTVGAPFPTPDLGRIIQIDPSGKTTTIATGLSLPTGMTMGPDGNLYVSNVGLGPTAIGGGQVLKVTLSQ